MTDFRARSTIMGPAGLTAVFGMGTGGAPQVWSPGNRPAGGEAAPVGRCRAIGVATRRIRARSVRNGGRFAGVRGDVAWPGSAAGMGRGRGATPPPPLLIFWHGVMGTVAVEDGGDRGPEPGAGAGRGGQAIGCWDRSAAAIARRPLPAHRPGRLPGAFAASSCRKPRLGGGFALRCFQRLSGPDLATRRCPGRDSRHTSGRSSPILSY